MARTENIPANASVAKKGVDYKISPQARAALNVFVAEVPKLSPVAYQTGLQAQPRHLQLLPPARRRSSVRCRPMMRSNASALTSTSDQGCREIAARGAPAVDCETATPFIAGIAVLDRKRGVERARRADAIAPSARWGAASGGCSSRRTWRSSACSPSCRSSISTLRSPAACAVSRRSAVHRDKNLATLFECGNYLDPWSAGRTCSGAIFNTATFALVQSR